MIPSHRAELTVPLVSLSDALAGQLPINPGMCWANIPSRCRMGARRYKSSQMAERILNLANGWTARAETKAVKPDCRGKLRQWG